MSNHVGSRRRTIVAQQTADMRATLPAGFVGGFAGSDVRPMVPETDNGMVHAETIPTKRRGPGRPRIRRVEV